MTSARRVVGLVLIAVLTACSPGQRTDSASPGGADSGVNPSAGPVVLDVTIINGEITPRGARVNLKVGQPLTLSIHSDVAVEIHVHTDPEQTFPVKAGGQQRVTFSVDHPGKVAVEVHDLDAVVAEVLVRK
jgi:hypothetical protein